MQNSECHAVQVYALTFQISHKFSIEKPIFGVGLKQQGQRKRDCLPFVFFGIVFTTKGGASCQIESRQAKLPVQFGGVRAFFAGIERSRVNLKGAFRFLHFLQCPAYRGFQRGIQCDFKRCKVCFRQHNRAFCVSVILALLNRSDQLFGFLWLASLAFWLRFFEITPLH